MAVVTLNVIVLHVDILYYSENDAGNYPNPSKPITFCQKYCKVQYLAAAKTFTYVSIKYVYLTVRPILLYSVLDGPLVRILRYTSMYRKHFQAWRRMVMTKTDATDIITIYSRPINVQSQFFRAW